MMPVRPARWLPVRSAADESMEQEQSGSSRSDTSGRNAFFGLLVCMPKCGGSRK